MLDFADLVALNKFDKRGFRCHSRRKKQYQRNHNLWMNPDEMPVLVPLPHSSMTRYEYLVQSDHG
jgi:putative protein kinase ArgK-like GTPase of G3E family